MNSSRQHIRPAPEDAEHGGLKPFSSAQNAVHSAGTGMLLFAASTMFVTLMSAQAKALSAQGIPVFQVVFARSLLMTAFCAIVLIKNKVNPLGNRRQLLVLRGFLGFGSVSTIFWTVALLPLNDSTLLAFLAPVFVAILGPFLLKETTKPVALVVVPVCLLGVGLIAKPSVIFHGVGLNPVGVMVGCLQAFFSATAKMSVRALRTTEQDIVIVVYMSVISMLGSGVLASLVPGSFWVLPTHWAQWVLLVGTGVAGLGNQLCMTAALRRVNALPAIALSYLSIIWSLLIGAIAFHEFPDLFSVLGALTICCSTMVLSMHEVGPRSQKESCPELKERLIEDGGDGEEGEEGEVIEGLVEEQGGGCGVAGGSRQCVDCVVLCGCTDGCGGVSVGVSVSEMPGGCQCVAQSGSVNGAGFVVNEGEGDSGTGHGISTKHSGGGDGDSGI